MVWFPIDSRKLRDHVYDTINVHVLVTECDRNSNRCTYGAATPLQEL